MKRSRVALSLFMGTFALALQTVGLANGPLEGPEGPVRRASACPWEPIGQEFAGVPYRSDYPNLPADEYECADDDWCSKEQAPFRAAPVATCPMLIEASQQPAQPIHEYEYGALAADVPCDVSYRYEDHCGANYFHTYCDDSFDDYSYGDCDPYDYCHEGYCRASCHAEAAAAATAGYDAGLETAWRINLENEGLSAAAMSTGSPSRDLPPGESRFAEAGDDADLFGYDYQYECLYGAHSDDLPPAEPAEGRWAFADEDDYNYAESAYQHADDLPPAEPLDNPASLTAASPKPSYSYDNGYGDEDEYGYSEYGYDEPWAADAHPHDLPPADSSIGAAAPRPTYADDAFADEYGYGYAWDGHDAHPHDLPPADSIGTATSKPSHYDYDDADEYGYDYAWDGDDGHPHDLPPADASVGVTSPVQTHGDYEYCPDYENYVYGESGYGEDGHALDLPQAEDFAGHAGHDPYAKGGFDGCPQYRRNEDSHYTGPVTDAEADAAGSVVRPLLRSAAWALSEMSDALLDLSRSLDAMAEPSVAEQAPAPPMPWPSILSRQPGVHLEL
jgi:hypothetical protein